MSNPSPFDCPECSVDRRDFLKALAVGTVAAASIPAVAVANDTKKTVPPAEILVKELFSNLSDSQKKAIQLPWEHPARSKMFNAAINKKIGDVYSKPQQELIQRILKEITSGEEGYRLISRGGTWDASKSFENCGANVFGDPNGDKFAFVFFGHHLTIRCDGDSEANTAFGGPIYYGHSPNGYAKSNIFQFQTQAVMNVYEALDSKQRVQATVEKGHPGEQEKSVQIKPKAEARPGIAFAALSKDQQVLVQSVMKAILSPYRSADVEEVMQIIQTTGGMEKIHLAFYKEGPEEDGEGKQPWAFWRLEGPGFVWNYRVLPHVHTFVRVAKMA